MKKIYLLTESDGFFGQYLMPWQSVDTTRLAELLSSSFQVEHLNFADVASCRVAPENSTIIHSSSQQPGYKSFVEDVLLLLQARRNTLVPSFDMVRAHENKGYQELIKKLHGIDWPAGLYAGKVSEVDTDRLTYPLVHKTTAGFGSSGVSLINSKQELHNACSVPIMDHSIGDILWIVKRKFWSKVARYILGRTMPLDYGDYFRKYAPFVLQEFVPNLACDYKVIISRGKAFVLRRSVRKNDFRASGSGLFSYERVPTALLNFSLSILTRLGEPYLSLDIGFCNDRYFLFEFQGVHFGPYTIINAPFHFARTALGWEHYSGKTTLEEFLADALNKFLEPLPVQLGCETT